MKTSIQQILDSQLRSEVLALFSKARTKRQLLFAFDSLVVNELTTGVEYFVQMMRRTHQTDDELVQEIEQKYSAYKSKINHNN